MFTGRTGSIEAEGRNWQQRTNPRGCAGRGGRASPRVHVPHHPRAYGEASLHLRRLVDRPQHYVIPLHRPRASCSSGGARHGVALVATRPERARLGYWCDDQFCRVLSLVEGLLQSRAPSDAVEWSRSGHPVSSVCVFRLCFSFRQF
jgi:hypothetical protein